MAQHFAVTHEQIKLIAVNHPQTTTVCRGVHCVSLDRNPVDGGIGPSSKTVVVVSRDVNHIGATFGLLHQVPENVVAVFVPRPLAPQNPLVDDVADEVDRFGVVGLKKSEQFSGFDAVKTKMPVREEERPVMFGRNVQMLPSIRIGFRKQ